jgi:hypothetical protein
MVSRVTTIRTFVNDTLKTCDKICQFESSFIRVRKTRRKKGVRMTLKSRAETAAAAIVQRMIIRRRPLVFLLVVPRNKGSTAVVAAMTANG